MAQDSAVNDKIMNLASEKMFPRKGSSLLKIETNILIALYELS